MEQVIWVLIYVVFLNINLAVRAIPVTNICGGISHILWQSSSYGIAL